MADTASYIRSVCKTHSDEQERYRYPRTIGFVQIHRSLPQLLEQQSDPEIHMVCSVSPAQGQSIQVPIFERQQQIRSRSVDQIEHAALVPSRRRVLVSGGYIRTAQVAAKWVVLSICGIEVERGRCLVCKLCPSTDDVQANQ